MITVHSVSVSIKNGKALRFIALPVNATSKLIALSILVELNTGLLALAKFEIKIVG